MSRTLSRSRRQFLGTASVLGLASALPLSSVRSFAGETRTPNERPRVGAIGVGGRGSGVARSAREFGDILAVCDVDRNRAEKAAADERLGAGKAESFGDYRRLLDRKDIDIVTIGTPDHWHSRIVVAALKAGKDVYCEKPLTLTIEEGQILSRAVKESGRVVQVGTQQRSEFRNHFLTAVAMVREGRLGKVRRVTCAIGGGLPARSGFARAEIPAGLDWDMWLGQAPKVDYIPERCHYTFRWWYEYSGGKLTDWGAHHVDIAHWALGKEDTGPRTISILRAEHPVPFSHGMPTLDDRYNTATSFLVRCAFADGIELNIRSDTENGITFEGEDGTIFVSRGKLVGGPVDLLKERPIEEAVFVGLRKGKRLDSHMANFFECVRDRSEPVSDVASHHRALTTCHLANIGLRLGRDLTWDPVLEKVVDDPEALAMQIREPRKGYEISG